MGVKVRSWDAGDGTQEWGLALQACPTYRAEIRCHDLEPGTIFNWCVQHLGPWPNKGRWTFGISHGRQGDPGNWVIIHTNSHEDHMLVMLAWA